MAESGELGDEVEDAIVEAVESEVEGGEGGQGGREPARVDGRRIGVGLAGDGRELEGLERGASRQSIAKSGLVVEEDVVHLVHRSAEFVPPVVPRAVPMRVVPGKG